MSTKKCDIDQRFSLLPKLFESSGGILRSTFRSGQIITATKDTLSPLVTVVDQRVESSLRQIIQQNFPDDSILGEEEEPKSGSSDFQWVIDPIDGTSSFVRGLPLFGTLIGCKDKSSDEIFFGGADQPILEERLIGKRGEGAFWNKDTIVNPFRYDKNWSLSESCICATTPEMFTTDYEKEVLHKVKTNCRRSGWGGDWYNFALMISGKSTIPVVLLEAGLQYYDICPLVPIIEEAGGVITDWSGKSISESTTQIISAPNHKLWDELLYLIA